MQRNLPLAALLISASISGCRTFSEDLPYRRTERVSTTMVVMDTVKNVVVELAIAELEIRPGEGRDVRLEGTSVVATAEEEELDERSGQVTLTASGDTLRVTGPKPERDEYQVHHRLKLTVPAELALTVMVGVGDVKVTSMTGGMRLETGVGELHAMSCSGSASLQSGVGDLVVRDHKGVLNAETGVGKIVVGLARIEGEGDMSLQSGVGDVRVELPDESDLRLTATAGVGAVSSDIASARKTVVDRGRVTAETGAARHALRITTGTGSIRISDRAR